MFTATARRIGIFSALACGLLSGACASTQQVASSARTMVHEAAHPERFIASPAELPPDLHIGSSDERLAALLSHWIIPEGPGTWVRDAKWDEVVLTLDNKTDLPIRVTAVSLVDPRGEPVASGDDPPEVESRTDRLMGEYEDVGLSVSIAAAPLAVYGAATLAGSAAMAAGLVTGTTVATGVAAGTVAAGGVGIVGVGAGSVAVVGAPILVPAAIVAAPVYYFWRKSKKEDDLERITSELRLRQLPFDVGPGSQVHGSQFFPIVPNPRTLAIEYTTGGTPYILEVPLHQLEGLHVGPKAEEGRESE